MIANVLQFLKKCWWHVLLLVPGCIAVTFVHESAHALAVLWQGGEVTEFVFLPDGENWGFVRYFFPEGVSHSGVAVALAPYFVWLGLAVVATGVAWLPVRWKFYSASIIYFWLFVAPLGDIGNAAFPWALAASDNDLHAAFGEAGAAVPIWIGAVVVAVFAWGFFLQRRLFREDSLSVMGFAALFVALVGGLVAFTC